MYNFKILPKFLLKLFNLSDKLLGFQP